MCFEAAVGEIRVYYQEAYVTTQCVHVSETRTLVVKINDMYLIRILNMTCSNIHDL